MIDEKKLIEEIKKFPVMNGEYDHEIADPSYVDGMEAACMAIIETIKETPKVGEWIPVSSGRLPKVGEYVLGTNNYDEVLVYRYGWNSPHSKKMFFHLCGAAGNVIAWMPRPEPYSERIGGE